MKRLFVASLVLVLLLTSVLPALAAQAPHNAMIATATAGIHDSVGVDCAGASLLLFENGRQILMEPYGYANIETRALTTADAGFELGRLSSLFVALSAYELAATGAVSLEKDITNYLPKDFVRKLELTHTLTLQDLLFCCGGFEGRSFDLHYDDVDYCFSSLPEALLCEVPKQIAPAGQIYAYSPFEVALAAYVLECAAKMPYETYVEQTILAPLGMTHTTLRSQDTLRVTQMSAGHVASDQGVFETAQGNGRRYSALWPADGAVSSLSDMSLLVAHLLQSATGNAVLRSARENGVFSLGLLGAGTSANIRLIGGETAYFGAVLAIDASAGRAALVMSNTADSALMHLPATLLGASRGVYVEQSAQLPSPEEFTGSYVAANAERDSLVGRLFIKNNIVKVAVTDEGILEFGSRRLRQIAPGIFADADSADNVAVLQFVSTIEGEVMHVVLSTGETYLPAGALEGGVPATLLLVAMLLLGCYFLLGAVLGTFVTVASRWRRDERDHRPWRFTLPWIFSGTMAALVLLQVVVAHALGGGGVASFYRVMSVLALLLAIGAIGSLLFAFFTAFTERGRTSRVAYTAMAFLAFFLLCTYWQTVLF